MSFLVAGAIAVGAAGTSIYASERARAQQKRKTKQYEDTLKSIENSRQEVINPYEDYSNPYNNLQVATGAADTAYTEADISLANVLDTLRETGSGAGGATALAQAASRSKREISDTIEAQEARNAELRARGEAEGQNLYAQGEMFKFNTQENRENVLLDRYAGLSQESSRLEQQYKQQIIDTISNTGANVATMAAGYGTGVQ